MKVLAIHGSPRTVRSTTRKVVQFVLDGVAEAGAETEIVDLCDLHVTPCTACEACSLNGICINDDDVPPLLGRMKEADGIILASPVYIDNVSGQMKVFFDRLADAIHYQVFAGKYGCSVSTTHTSGGDEVVAYLNHVLNYLGIVSVGGIGIATGGDMEVVEAKASGARVLGRKLADAMINGVSDKKQEEEIADNREFFKDMVIENQALRTDDYKRWVRMGWIR